MTPLSDHFHALFSAYASDYQFSDTEYDDLFDRFELLAGLAHLTLSYDSASLASAMQDTFRHGIAWYPPGRATCRMSPRDSVVSQLQVGPLRSKVLKAGFAHGDEGFLDLAIKNHARMNARLSAGLY